MGRHWNALLVQLQSRGVSRREPCFNFLWAGIISASCCVVISPSTWHASTEQDCTSQAMLGYTVTMSWMGLKDRKLGEQSQQEFSERWLRMLSVSCHTISSTSTAVGISRTETEALWNTFLLARSDHYCCMQWSCQKTDYPKDCSARNLLSNDYFLLTGVSSRHHSFVYSCIGMHVYSCIGINANY